MRLKKRTLVLLGAAVVAISLAVGAYAYFTTSGSGSGTATVGTSTAVALHGDAPDTVYPGGATSVVNFTVDNPSSGSQFVTTIHLDSITAYPTALDRTNDTAAIVGCGSINEDLGSGNAETADFYMADVDASQNFPNGDGQAVTATGTLVMNDTGSDQDACKNAFLKLVLSSV